MINNEELLFVVDENNSPIEPKTRKEVHENGYWHRISHIWIINSEKQILCQKRSILKDINPGKWEAHFGGHVAAGEEYVDNAVKETKEEVGIDRKKEDMIFVKTYAYQKDKEFQGIFYTKWDGDITTLVLEKEEVEKIAWMNIEELKKIFDENNPIWVHDRYGKDLIDFINEQ